MAAGSSTSINPLIRGADSKCVGCSEKNGSSASINPLIRGGVAKFEWDTQVNREYDLYQSSNSRRGFEATRERSSNANGSSINPLIRGGEAKYTKYRQFYLLTPYQSSNSRRGGEAGESSHTSRTTGINPLIRGGESKLTRRTVR